MATESLHPSASHHLPSFITAPGETDVLMVVCAVILVVAVLAFGVLFLTLHTLPERIAHKSHKLQFEIVAILGLLALFTHVHLFWVAGLLLALIDFPDFGGFLGRISGSLERIADNSSNNKGPEASGEVAAGAKRDDGASKTSDENITSIRRVEGVAPTKPDLTPVSTRN